MSLPAERDQPFLGGDVSCDVAVCIVSWNTRDLLRTCLKSLFEHTRGVRFEVIVVDNASCDGSPEMVARDFPAVRLVCNRENAGFACGCNQAMTLAGGRYFLLFNSDAWIEDDVLSALVSFMDKQPDVGAGGCTLRYPDGRLQPSCGWFPTVTSTLFNGLSPRALFHKVARNQEHFPSPFLPYKLHAFENDIDWIVGACIIARRETVRQVGLMDESIFMFGEEWEWCMRIKAHAWRIAYTPIVQVVHVGSGSWTMSDASRVYAILASEYYIFRKHHGALYAWLFKTATFLNALAKALAWNVFLIVRPAKLPNGDPMAQWHVHTLRWCLRRAGNRMLSSQDVAPPASVADESDREDGRR